MAEAFLRLCLVQAKKDVTRYYVGVKILLHLQRIPVKSGLKQGNSSGSSIVPTILSNKFALRNYLGNDNEFIYKQ